MKLHFQPIFAACLLAVHKGFFINRMPMRHFKSPSQNGYQKQYRRLASNHHNQALCRHA
jgi:hypothetical protein